MVAGRRCMPPLRRSSSPPPDLQGRGGDPCTAGRIRRPLPRICKGEEGRGRAPPDPPRRTEMCAGAVKSGGPVQVKIRVRLA